MDSFELNKIMGAVLGTLLFVMGAGFLAEVIYAPIEGRGPGYELPEAEEDAASAEETTGEAQPAVSIGLLLASANAEDGRAQARKCGSCHTFEQGGSNGQGPNLYGVVGRPIAGHEGYAYSEAMVQHAAEAGDWSYDELNAFLAAPKARIPGTKMNFAGLRNDEERANIIAYMSTLSDAPVPFPAPEAPIEQPTPGSEGAEPTQTEANQTSDTPTTTQSETPVAGTATGSNVPAGAESGSNPVPAPSQPTAPADAAQNMAPGGGQGAGGTAPAEGAAPAGAEGAGETAPAEGAAPAGGEAPPAGGEAPAQAAPAAGGTTTRPAVQMTAPPATPAPAQ